MLYALTFIFYRSSDVIRTNLNLQDVFEAVTREQCSQFSCPDSDIRAGKLGTDEARQNDRSEDHQTGDHRRPQIPQREDLSRNNR